MFEITTEEFNSQKALFESFNKILKVEYRQDDDFEDKYIIIMSNGDVVKTENNVDIKIGNVFEENLKKILQNYEKNSIFVNALKKLKEGNTMNKIRTIVAHNDDKARNLIINTINTLDFVDVVGTATNGINTYNKIVELQPDMVFAEYRMSDMDGIELIKKSKEKLENKTPMFNIIGENIPFEEIEKSSNVIGDNINALVNNNDQDRIINILKEYREYKEFMNIE